MTSRYLLPFFHQCRITVQSLSVSLYNPTTLLKRNCGPYNCRKYWYYVFTLHTLMFFSPDSNDMTSWQRSSAENVSCNVSPFIYHHNVVIQHLVSDTMYHTGSFCLFQRKTYIILDKRYHLTLQTFLLEITYAISAYHHWCCEFESRSERSMQHYVIKYVSDLLKVGSFLRVLRFPSPLKLTTTI
jgi:hypothetical protein